MDFEPGTLLALPSVAEFVQVATMAFASAALLAAGCVVACVGRECRCLRRSIRQRDEMPELHASVHASVKR